MPWSKLDNELQKLERVMLTSDSDSEIIAAENTWRQLCKSAKVKLNLDDRLSLHEGQH